MLGEPKESNVGMWWFAVDWKDDGNRRSDWYFIDQENCERYVRDWIEQRAKDCLDDDDDKSVMYEVMRKLKHNRLDQAAAALGDYLNEAYDWGGTKLQTYAPPAIDAMKEAIGDEVE